MPEYQIQVNISGQSIFQMSVRQQFHPVQRASSARVHQQGRLRVAPNRRLLRKIGQPKTRVAVGFLEVKSISLKPDANRMGKLTFQDHLSGKERTAILESNSQVDGECNSCLSEVALRQRYSKIRQKLKPLALLTRNALQLFYGHRRDEEQVCVFLKQNEDLAVEVSACFAQRNRVSCYLQHIAECIFKLTDRKNIGLEVFNEAIAEQIQRRSKSLQDFVQFMEECFEESDTLRITDFIENAQKRAPKDLVCSIQKLFRYLYFMRRVPSLQIKPKSVQLEILAPFDLDLEVVHDFAALESRTTDQFVDNIEEFADEVNALVEQRPEITGHKKFILECNYLAEAVLSLISRKVPSRAYHVVQGIMRHYKDASKLQQFLDGLEGMAEDDLERQYPLSRFEENESMGENEFISSNQSMGNRYRPYDNAIQDYKEIKEKIAEVAERSILKLKEMKTVVPKKQQLNKSDKAEQQTQKAKKAQQPSLKGRKQSMKRQSAGLPKQSPPDTLEATSSSNLIETISRIESMEDYLLRLLDCHEK